MLLGEIYIGTGIPREKKIKSEASLPLIIVLFVSSSLDVSSGFAGTSRVSDEI